MNEDISFYNFSLFVLSPDNFMANQIKKAYTDKIEKEKYSLLSIKEKYYFLKNASSLNLTYTFLLITLYLLLDGIPFGEKNDLIYYFLEGLKLVILYKTISRTIMTILLFSEDIIGKDKAEIKKRVMEKVDFDDDYLNEDNLAIISKVLNEKNNFTEEEKLFKNSKNVYSKDEFTKRVNEILNKTNQTQEKNIIQRLMKELNISDIDENYKIEKTYINNQSNETCKDKCNYDFNLKSVNNEKNNNKTIYKHIIKSFIKEHIFMSKSSLRDTKTKNLKR